eukprot:1152565-Pelagomonas_calceolata.AAC.5
MSTYSRTATALAGAAYFHFAELCAAVTGPADFTALAQHYHTLFIHGVPAMSMQMFASVPLPARMLACILHFNLGFELTIVETEMKMLHFNTGMNIA